MKVRLLYLFFNSYLICNDLTDSNFSFDKIFHENNYARACKHAAKSYYALVRVMDSPDSSNDKDSDSRARLAFTSIAWKAALADFYYIRMCQKSRVAINFEDIEYLIYLHDKMVDMIESMANKNRALYSIALVFVECNNILNNLKSASDIEV